MKKIRSFPTVLYVGIFLVSFHVAALASAEDTCVAKSDNFVIIPAKVISRVNIPSGYHEGLRLDGDKIWINNGNNIKTWVVDISSGKVVSEIAPCGTFTEAMTDGPDGHIFMTDWYEKKIFKITVTNNTMVPESVLSLAPAYPAGIAWNGKFFYVITWTRGGWGTKFHLLELGTNGSIIRKIRIKNIDEPTQLAWDGRYLWISSWYKKAVHKMDLEKLELVGYFKSPVARTTGIAWDGKYFWLTGTSSDLYKLEVG